ncbi:hypothetical protein EX30DRAFT_370987 [Ascodesmis nigricans]|uniref:Uncharacterized protein n=1 Tax=Ascodesmis nigricans TaxID=341454 RepID=A0A4S2N0B5_9PEZI|nr:hypothetical protein EX30DRAFT_370987 [Ascodesmis nigricans]
MSFKQEIETWIVALEYLDNEDYVMAIRVFENISDTSKICFNIGMIYATIGKHHEAVESFSRAVTFDSFFAVAYFQMGVCNFILERYRDAMADFNDALLYFRGSSCIKYEQVGLQHHLYTCEVLFNRGLCYLKDRQRELGMRDLEFASHEKQTMDHHVIDDAIRDHAIGYTVFSLPPGLVFRPDPTKVRNLPAKDFLGKARLIATIDASNSHTEFTGAVVKENELKRDPEDDREPHQISYAATHLVRHDLQSNRRPQQKGDNQPVWPPKPPPFKPLNDQPSYPFPPSPTVKKSSFPKHDGGFVVPPRPVRANTVPTDIGLGSPHKSLQRGPSQTPIHHSESLSPPRRTQPARIGVKESVRRSNSDKNAPLSTPRNHIPQASRPRGPAAASSSGYSQRASSSSVHRREQRTSASSHWTHLGTTPQSRRIMSRHSQEHYISEIPSNPFTDEVVDSLGNQVQGLSPTNEQGGTASPHLYVGPLSSVISEQGLDNHHFKDNNEATEQYTDDGYAVGDFDEGGRLEYLLYPPRPRTPSPPGGGPRPMKYYVKTYFIDPNTSDPEIRKVIIFNPEIRKIIIHDGITFSEFMDKLRSKFEFNAARKFRIDMKGANGEMIPVAGQEELDSLMIDAKARVAEGGGVMGGPIGKIYTWMVDLGRDPEIEVEAEAEAEAEAGEV